MQDRHYRGGCAATETPAGSICGNDDGLYVCSKGLAGRRSALRPVLANEEVARGNENEGYGQQDGAKGVDFRDDAHPGHAV